MTYRVSITKPGTPLGERETEVLVLLAKGCTNKEIARLLELSAHTVNDYLKLIFKRLDVDNRVEAAVWAAKQGLV